MNYNPKYNGVPNGNNYIANAYRPSKLRSLNRNQNMANGLSGERIRLNNHASHEKLSNYSGNYGSPGNDKRTIDPN